MKLTWKAPSQEVNGLPIIKYEVHLNGQSLAEVCNPEISNQPHCSIPISELSRFKLKAKKPMIMKVKAQNAQGWSEWSPVTVGKMPPLLKQGKLKLNNKTQNKITLVWDKLFSQNKFNIYELYWDVDGTFNKFAEVQDNWHSVTLKDELTVTEVTFKLKARTNCGLSPFSEPLTVLLKPQVPGPLKDLFTASDECKLLISWVAPDQPVTSIHLAVQNPDSHQFHPINMCGKLRASDTTCSVEIKDLARQPFSLNNGDSIVVKAWAKNEDGIGEPVNVHTTQMSWLPQDVNLAPRMEQQTENSVTLAWDHVANSDKYELFWDGHVLGKFERLIELNSANWYKVENVKRQGIVRFKLRTKNECGHGSFSKDLAVNFEANSEVPGQIQPLTTKTDKCNVIVSWKSPDDKGFPILKYELGLKGAQLNTFFWLDTLCRKSAVATQCTIPMKQLSQSPYNLMPNDLVVVRASAWNRNGRGKSSQQNTSGARMTNFPQQVSYPRIDSQSSSSVTLLWDPVQTFDSENDSYELFWNYDQQEGSFVKHSDSKLTWLKISNIQMKDPIKFKLRHRTACDIGPFSEETSVQIERQISVPGQMKPVTTEYEKCDVVVKWDAPEDGGSPIVKYKLAVKDAAYRYYPLDSTCSQISTLLECMIPVDILAKAPYFLKAGDLITVRAVAVNAAGEGIVSVPNTEGAKMKAMPPGLDIPRVEGRSDASIIVGWENAFQTAAGENLYEVFWDQRNDRKFKKLVETSSTSYLLDLQKENTCCQVSLKVRAKNECYSGEFSEALVVDFTGKEQAPLQMKPLVTTLDNCSVIIQWEKPVSKDSPIKRYDIEISGEGNAFYTLNENCSGVDKKQCSVLLSTLVKPPYLLREGDLIIARGSAKNDNGWSKLSAPNLDGAYMIQIAPVIDELNLIEKQASQITFKWDAPFYEEKVAYLVYWDSGLGGEFEKLARTEESQFTVRVKKTGKFRFMVKVDTQCGVGSQSPVLEVEKSNVPHLVQEVSTKADQCRIKVMWTEPVDGGQPIKGYKIEVQGHNSQNFYPIDASLSSTSLSHSIPMSLLAQAPFNLQKGQLIVTRVSAENVHGFGNPSTPFAETEMVSVPPLISQPTILEKTATSLKLRWSKAGASQDTLVSYELSWDEQQHSFTKHAILNTTTYELKDLAQNSQLRIRVRAFNPCGYGDYSPDLVAKLQQKAPQMSSVTTEAKGCTVVLTWKPNGDVNHILLEVKNKQGKFVAIDGCSNEQSQCFVAFGTLSDEPYSLQEGELIVARVSAKIEGGWGLPSKPNINGARMIQLPTKIGQPQIKSRTKNILLLNWRFDFEQYRTGKYEILWAKVNQGTFNPIIQSEKNSYSLEGISKDMQFRVKVRAMTSCGFKVSSPILQVNAVQEPPSQMRPVTTRIHGCALIVQWEKPKDGGAVITQYSIEVQNRKSQQMYPLSATICGRNGQKTTCTIPIGLLRESPYFLQENELIVIRGYAKNQLGWGPPSLLNLSGVKMIRLPSAIDKLKIENRVANQLTISWQFQQQQFLNGNFEIQRAELKHGQYTKMAISSQPKFTLTMQKEEFRLRVIASTSCGFNVESEELIVQQTYMPNRMAPVTTEMQGCNLMIKWTSPKNNGISPTTKYKVEAQRRNGQTFFSLDAHCGQSYHSCLVPMGTLANAPFFLQDGDSINIRVYAKNKEGWSLPSLVNSEASKMVWFPSSIGTPRVVKKGSDQVTIQWGLPNSKDKKDLYELYWDRGTFGRFVKLDTTIYNKYTISNLKSKDTFSFKVGILTSCGYGVFSPLLSISMIQRPNQINSVRTFIQGCDVQISWNEPSSNGSPIIAYKVGVLSISETYHSLNGYCGKFKNYCVVPLKILNNSPFFLKDGDLVIVSIAARNSMGWSTPSPRNANGARMSKLPIMIQKPRVESRTADSVDLIWNYAFSTYSNFNAYEVYWSQNKKEWKMLDRTTSIKYSVKYFSQSEGFKFKVRAVTSCGQGQFSPEIFVKEMRAPKKVQNVITSIQGCNLLISWIVPLDGGSKITNFKIEAESVGKYYSINELCREDKLVTGSCTIPINLMKSAPLSLQSSDIIKVRISAKNILGVSPFTVSNSGTRMINIGPTVPKIRLKEKTASSITIEWDSVHQDSYEVWLANSSIRQFVKIANVQINRYAYKVQNEVDFALKVRAKSRCGSGSFSPSLEVSLKSCPEQIKQVSTQIEGCNLMIRWKEPYNGNLAIQSYRVQVKQHIVDEGLFQKIGNYIQHAVPMSGLSKSPFNLVYDELIVVEIMSKNSQGWSQTSVPNKQGAKMISLPYHMNHPWIVERTISSVTIGWDKIFREKNQEGQYELLWDNTDEKEFQPLCQTSMNTYKIENLSKDGIIRFKLRSRTNCGIGPFSEELEVKFEKQVTFPSQMQPLQLLPKQCDVIFVWVAPGDDGGSPITEYRLRIQGSKGNIYHNMDSRLCDLSAGQNSCIVSMNALASPPYNLEYGDKVVSMISAFNSKGQSQFSNANSNGPNILTLTQSVKNIRMLNSTQESVNIGWDDAFTEVQMDRQSYYEIFWNEHFNHTNASTSVYTLDNNNNFTRLAATTTNNYQVDFFGRDYIALKARAVSPCGSAPFSQVIIAKFARKKIPERMKMVSTAMYKCQVKVRWERPVSDLPITQYKIEVRSRILEQFTQFDDQCGQADTLSCTIPMNVFANFPYFLKDGDLIVIRISALNTAGWSQPSIQNVQGAVLITHPPYLSLPSLDGQSATSLTISWDNVLGSGFYEFLWDKFGTVKQFSKLLTLTDNKYIINNVPNSGTFRFRIKATNECGYSSISPVLLVNVVAEIQLPSQLETVIVENSACNVNFAWMPPNDNGGAPIKKYVFEVQASGNEFFEIQGLCQPSIGSNLHCQIPMHAFSRAPFNLKHGDSVVVRASAVNAKGTGIPSLPNTEGAQMVSSPSTVASLIYTKIPGKNNQVKLSWQPIPSLDKVVMYELLWDQNLENGQIDETIVGTNETFHTMEIEPNKIYRFAVRAHNLCGYGQLSEELTLQIEGQPPPQLQPLVVTKIDCDIVFEVIPTFTVEPIEQYRIEVKSGIDEFVGLDKQYQQSPLRTSVPISVLRRPPYSIMGQVHARVLAENIYGWSVPSDVNQVGAQLISLPSEIKDLIVNSNKPNQLYLQWNDLPQELYEVWVAAVHMGSSFTKLTEQKANFLLLEGLPDEGIYKVKVRGKNHCGEHGLFSAIVTSTMMIAPPEQLPRPIVLKQQSACAVLIRWKNISNQKKEINRYVVQVLIHKDDAFQPDVYRQLPSCGDEFFIQKETQCVVAMNVLQNEPYNIKAGDPIYIRVAAENEAGLGPASLPNLTPVLIHGPLQPMNTPTFEQIEGDKTQLLIRWKPANLTGYPVIIYELMWNEGYKNTPATEKLSGSKETIFVLKNIVPGRFYKFAVRVLNLCGFSQLSTELTVRIKGNAPPQMDPIMLTVRKCSIKLVSINRAPGIVDQQINIQGSKRVFYPISKKYCDKYLNIVTCLVPMADLKLLPFNLKGGDSIITQAISRNEHGWSVPSLPSTRAIKLISSPPKMRGPTIDYGTANQVTLSLEKVQGAFSYELWLTTGLDNDQFKKVDEIKARTLGLNGLQPDTFYRLRMRAKNACGDFGLFSDVVTVAIKTSVPPMVVQISVTKPRDSCSVEIAWKSPQVSKNAGPISNFRLEVSGGASSTFSEIACGKDSLSRTCSISMATLYVAPYSIPVGQRVYVRITAQNTAGFGPPSDIISGPKMIAKPGRVSKPSYTLVGQEAVRVQWEPLVNAGSYELSWNRGVVPITNERLASGSDTFFVVPNLQLNQRYRFTVQARNECGNGPPSIELLYQRQQQVERLNPVIVQLQQSSCTVEFKTAVTGLSQNYKIEVQGTGGGKYHKLDEKFCGQSENSYYCILRMVQLREEPFFLLGLDTITARSAAQGKLGWGKYSVSSDDSVKFTALPPRMEAPQISSTSRNSVTFVWKSLDVEGYSYELWLQSGLGIYGKLIETLDTSHTVSNLQRGINYKFKLRATNRLCGGSGQFSDEITIGLDSSLPPRPVSLSIDEWSDGCGIQIGWSMPQKSSITGYRVEVQTFGLQGRAAFDPITGKRTVNFVQSKNVAQLHKKLEKLLANMQDQDNEKAAVIVKSLRRKIRKENTSMLFNVSKFSSENIFCGQNPSQTSCRIPMHVLKKPPYNLLVGSPITVRVSSLNRVGASQYFEQTAMGIVVQSAPYQMPKPKYAVKSDDSVKIFWEDLTLSKSGYTPVQKYQLITLRTGQKLQFVDVQDTSHALNNMIPGREYSYAVRAVNKCGTSKMSSAFSFFHRKKVNMLSKVQVSRTPNLCGFIITWDGGVGQSTEVEVLLPGLDSFLPLSGCKGSGCTVSMSQLMSDPYNMKAGQPLSIQVHTAGGITESIDTPLFIEANVIKMNAPTRTMVTKDTMEVRWESENFDSYQLYWDQGSGIVTTPLYQGSKTEFRVSELEADRIYRFKVRGQNQCGYGEFSDVALFLTGKSCPSPPLQPTVTLTNRKIVIKWKQSTSALNEPAVSQYLVLFEKSDTFYTSIDAFCDGKSSSVLSSRICTVPLSKVLAATNLTDPRKIRVTIAAKNLICTGEFSKLNSEVQSTEEIGIPGIVDIVRSTIEPQSGDLKIEWEKPDNGFEVKSFTIQIQDSRGKWRVTNECSIEKRTIYQSNTQVNSLFCIIKMVTLRQKYKLQFPMVVKIRIRASNLLGYGNWSIVNEKGASIRMEPAKIPKPNQHLIETISDTQQNEIHIQWTKMTTQLQTGGSVIWEYVLEGSEENNDFVELYRGQDNNFSIQRVKPGVIYKFRVTARNVYGNGPFSDILTVQTSARPDTMKKVLTRNLDDSQIQIMWEIPKDNGSPISQYNVEIYDKRLQRFREIRNLCDGSSPKKLLSRQCTIDAGILQRKYGYISGDLLLAKVQARNKWGWGGYSIPNQIGATVFKLVAFGG